MIITRPDLKFYKTIKLPLTVLFSRQIPRFSHVQVHVYSMLFVDKHQKAATPKTACRTKGWGSTTSEIEQHTGANNKILF